MEKNDSTSKTISTKPAEQHVNEEEKLPTLPSTSLMDRKRMYQHIAAIVLSALALILVVWGIVKLVKPSESSCAGKNGFDKIASLKESSAQETQAPKDYTRALQDVKIYCQDQGMMIVDGETPTGFEAIGYSMRLVVTVEETRGESFPDLVDRLVWKTAPCNETVPVKRTKMFMYEGLLDKDHPEFGYVYLRLFECGDHYVFIQGLGTAAKDDVIYQARAVAAEIMRKLGIS